MSQAIQKKPAAADGKKKKKAGPTPASQSEKPLNILILEDNPADAELIEHQLRKAGIDFVPERVKTGVAFRRALRRFSPDLILADYSLPGFNALQALELRNRTAPFTPFIIVTGSISEGIAVQCMKQGADDYLLKDRMARLPEAAKHALETRRLQSEKTEAEETLRKSEENFTDIFQTVREGIAYTTLSGKVISINSALEQILEIPGKDIVDRNILYLTRKLLSRDNIKKAIPVLTKLLRGKEIAGLQVEYKNRVLEINATANKKTKRLTGVIRDVTERRRYEVALQAAAARWRTTFDSMNDAVCLLDEKGSIQQCNRAMHRLLGLSFDKIIGRDCQDLICGARKKALCAFRLLKKARWRQEEEKYWRGRWYHVAVDPIVDAGGSIIGAVHIMSDVTDAKKAQAELDRSERQFRDLYENATIGLYRTTPDGRIVMANHALVRMLGFESLADLTARNLERDGFEPEYPRRDFQERMRRDGQVFGFESAWKRRDGTTLFIRESAVIVTAADGSASYYDGTIEDISERKRAEAALRENEAFMDSIIEQSPVAMWISDAQGTLIRINPACRKVLHITSDEVIGKYNLLQDSIVKAQGLLPLVRKVFENGEVVRFEIAYDTAQLKKPALAQKASLILDTTIFPIKDLQGRVTHAVIQNLDISQRRRAEESLREMNEIFGLFLKHSPIYVFIKDENIRPVYLSANYEKLLGRPLSEILGKSMDELFPSELSRTMIADDKEILHEGKTRELIEELGGRIFSTLKFPIFIQGKAKYLAGYTIDITKRRHAEETLQVTSKRLELALASAKAGTWDWDIVSNHIEWSSQMFELFGLDPQTKSASFELWRNVLHPEDRETAESRIDQAMKQRTTLDSDYRVVLPGGRIRWINALGECAYDDAGHAIHMIGICQDISDRKQTEEQIRASLLEKEVLLKEIHHRVKNNLQVISGLLTLQAEQLHDKRLEQLIKESQSRIWTMALIHQTLYQSGNLADIDMADYIRSLAGNLLSSHARIAMPPAARFDLLPLRLVIDRAIPLALIINELLTNAMKHAFPDGRPGEIRVSLRKCRPPTCGGDKAHLAAATHGYELTVADNGAGLPAGFDPKNQQSLGLQLVAMLTQQLGGSFNAANEAGAVFRVSFDADEEKE